MVILDIVTGCGIEAGIHSEHSARHSMALALLIDPLFRLVSDPLEEALHYPPWSRMVLRKAELFKKMSP